MEGNAFSLRLGVEPLILAGCVRTFRTQKDALDAGKQYGWRTALRVQRRFERVWIVGVKIFPPLSDDFDEYRIPFLKWNRDPLGIEYCPIVSLRVKKQGGKK